MKLIINNNGGTANLKQFIFDVVTPTAVKIFHSFIDKKRYSTYEIYLKELYKAKDLNLFLILSSGIKNLALNIHGNEYEISIDPNIKAPGIPAKLIDICALVNYGNLQLNPYPIFDIVMEKLGNQVPSLYAEYKLLGGDV